MLVGYRPTKKTAKKKNAMSGRGRNKGSRKRKASDKKAKQPKSSKRPQSSSTKVKPSTPPPPEIPGDCANGPLLVDSFPELIKAIQGVYRGP